MITLDDSPEDMFGKVMSIRDELLPKYFEVCTDVETQEVEKILQEY